MSMSSALPRHVLSILGSTVAGLFVVGVIMFSGVLMLAGPAAAAETSAPSGPGPSAFVISSDIYVMPPGPNPESRCSGAPALLWPGVTRCLVYRVHNTLSQPITVQMITMGLDPGFPPPPSGCSPDKLSLPGFSGSLTVAAGASAQTPGLPIRLENTTTNQDNCKQTVLHFIYASSATYLDGGPVPNQGPPNQGPPNQQLPYTGVHELVGILLSGGALVSAGLILLAAGRRRRDGVAP